MRDLWNILLRFGNRGALILAVCAGTISGFGNTAILGLVNRMMNLRMPQGRQPWMVWSFVGLCLAVPLLRVVSTQAFESVGTRAARDLRLEITHRILSAPLRRLEELGPQRLLVALYEDAGVLADSVTRIPILAINLALVIGALGYMGWLSPGLLIAVLAMIVLGAVSYRLPLRAARRKQLAVHDHHETLFVHFRGLTQGIKELQMHRERRAAFVQELRATSDSLRRLQLAARLILVTANSWGSLLSLVVIGLLFLVVPSLTIVSHETLTGYALVLLFLTGPLEVVLSTVPDLTRASVAAQQIAKLGASLMEVAPPVDSAVSEPVAAWTSLDLTGVIHSYHREYEEERFVLGPIELHFSPRQIVFLIGGNGSGKTTLAKLLLGLYLPEQGEIRFNGELVTGENLERYRENFSVVFSDYFLFSSLLGLDAPGSDDQARGYIKKLQLDRKVRVEQGHLSTTELSQGQRKRLALLTAYLEDRPIYLFDEWAADQDPQFKEIFYYQILPELKARGRTVIVISHDDRYYGVADRIIKLDDGAVVSDLPVTPSELSLA